MPQPKQEYWDWDVFGEGQLIFHFAWYVPRWKRIVSGLIFGGRWTKLEPVHNGIAPMPAPVAPAPDQSP